LPVKIGALRKNWCGIGAEIILESKKPLQIKEF